MSLKDKLRSLGPNFDKLDELTIVTGILVNVSPLRIGKGKSELGEPTELSIEKLPDGTPYVPGSSLKGALRSLAEKLAKSSGHKICNIFMDLTPCELAAAITRKALDAIESLSIKPLKHDLVDILSRAKRTSEEIRELANSIENIVNEIQDTSDLENAIEKIMEELKELPCPVCRIFGNKELASHVRIMNAYPKDEAKPELQFRTRVALDRFRKASRSGALFDYEFVPPGYKWDFEMRIYNLNILEPNEDQASKLLKHVLDYVSNLGLEIGGMKSVGHGLIKFEELKAKVYHIKDFKVELMKEVNLFERH